MIWQVLLTPSLPSLAGGGTLKLYSNDSLVYISGRSSQTWNYGEPFILSCGLHEIGSDSNVAIVLDGITIYGGALNSAAIDLPRLLYNFVDMMSDNVGVYGLSFPVYDSIKITNNTKNTMSLGPVRIFKYVTD